MTAPAGEKTTSGRLGRAGRSSLRRRLSVLATKTWRLLTGRMTRRSASNQQAGDRGRHSFAVRRRAGDRRTGPRARCATSQIWRGCRPCFFFY
ncbi:hypothetical protein XA68_14186 [Ophiocordyceps unilateralis]|uniref:Uncharacterized protein n=1 Tax=Ophiocordyceps unilateralis TaxID=268505 RepID=A0A2A9PA52_OPHUN|nr:hypothetical protein XA68_14186 [Ophiocordyceps unilateralis]